MAQDDQLSPVVDALRAAHPLFAEVTVQRLVDRVACDYRLLEGTDLHLVTVHDEAERQLSYADPGCTCSDPRLARAARRQRFWSRQR